MKAYGKQECTMMCYLSRLGALTLKSERDAGRLPNEHESASTEPVPTNLDDSLSETRPMSDESDHDVVQPDPFPIPTVNRRAFIEPIKRAREKAPKCANCGTGFRGNTRITCSVCSAIYHKRHFSVAERMEEPFRCSKCKSSELEPQQILVVPDQSVSTSSSSVSITGT